MTGSRFINITSTDSILFLFMTNTTVYICSILLYPSSVNRHLGYFLEIIFKIYSTSWLGTTSILHKISRKFLKNHANFRVLICLYGNSKISYIIEFSIQSYRMQHIKGTMCEKLGIIQMPAPYH